MSQQVDKIADLILTHVVYGGREGFIITAEDRDDHEYTNCQNAARTILAELAEVKP